MQFEQDFLNSVAKAHSVVFFTGAGISAESGIPTFRGKDGIWNKLKPEELANFDAFLKNPDMVWEWYNHRRKIVHESKPNPAHRAIVEAGNIFPEVSVITQNIDNLHKRAGSKTVYELHGNIERNYCVECKKYYTKDFIPEKGVPRCECGGLIRPDVVWFGEYLPQNQLIPAENASRNCNVFFIVGTSAIVYPAASLIHVARERGAYLVEVNIQKTEITRFVNKSFIGEAGNILPQIIEAVKGAE